MKNFKDKIVVITGAGSGMGRAYALEFAQLGSKVALNDYDQKGLDETIALLKEQGSSTVYAQAFDVSNKALMFEFADNVERELGKAHIIINNAGIASGGLPIYHMEDDALDRNMAVNFYGVTHGTRAFLPHLVANNEGAVVNVSSIFGLVGVPSAADYCAAKFAVRGFTESLMAEFLNSPVQIHCVYPGGIDTNIAKNDEWSDFSDKYLTTPPEKIVKHVVKCIKKNKPKIVYGKDSYKTWVGANLMPQKWLSKMIWSNMQDILKLDDYVKFNKK